MFFNMSSCFFQYYLLHPQLVLCFLFCTGYISKASLFFCSHFLPHRKFYVPRYCFSSSRPLLRSWSYRFVTQQCSLEHNRWGKKEKYIRCTLFTKTKKQQQNPNTTPTKKKKKPHTKAPFYNCSESFLLICHLHWNPSESSGFLRHSSTCS